MKEKVNCHSSDGLDKSELEIKQKKVMKNLSSGTVSETPGRKERPWLLLDSPSWKQFICKCL